MSQTTILPSKFIKSVATIFSMICLLANGEANDDGFIGFTVDLIHRDSPQSPTYDPSLTHSQRLANALKRSFNRVNRFKNHGESTQYPVSNVTIDPGSGEYIVKFSIGSPPFTSLGIADTGSHLTWTQCLPCKNCDREDQPIFNPKRSSTYKLIACYSKICNASSQYADCEIHGMRRTCYYSIQYGDGSYTEGDLATDVLTLGSSEGKNVVTIANFLFGCGLDNDGPTSPHTYGIIGLAPGEPSLISQLGPSIRGKFSYCLIPNTSSTTKSSKLNFGANAVVSGQGVISTVLKISTYYYLTLEGISVGNQRLEFLENPSSSPSNGSTGKNASTDIIIDSGTTLTYLPSNLYDNLKKAVTSTIKLPRVEHSPLPLCYKTRQDIPFTDVVLHFKGGDVNLKPENVFVRTSEETLCLAFYPANDDVAIFGNIAQGNFLVGYDLEKGTVSFKPTDCSKS